MSTLSIASFGTSPGLTTAAVALSLHWPRPVFLVEADVSKPSTVVTGFMQGSIGADSGLMGMVQASLRQAVTSQDIWDFAIPLHPTPRQAPTETTQWLLAGLPNPAAAQAMKSFWSELLDALTRMGSDGYDAIFDLGRVEHHDGRNELITGTDHLLIAVRSDLTSIAALKTYLQELKAVRERAGASSEISLIVVEDTTHLVPNRDITKFLGVNVAGRIPHLPRAASRYSAGAVVSPRKSQPYDKSVRAIAATVNASLAKRRDLLRVDEPRTTSEGSATHA